MSFLVQQRNSTWQKKKCCGFFFDPTEHPSLEFWVSVGNQMPTPSIAVLGFHGGQATRAVYKAFLQALKVDMLWVLPCCAILYTFASITPSFKHFSHERAAPELQAPDINIAKVFKPSAILMPGKGLWYGQVQWDSYIDLRGIGEGLTLLSRQDKKLQKGDAVEKF